MKRTKEEIIKYLKNLSYHFGKIAHQENDEKSKGKAEAYELAAFEIERNMK